MTEYRREIRLAGEAYRAALASKWERAGRCLVRLGEECVEDGLHIALIAWCDTYIDHATDGVTTPLVKAVNFIRTSTGQLDRQGSLNVPDRIQWAGKLVQARAAMDHDAWQSVIGELPEDPQQIFSYVRAVLECVALSVNGLPRGFVRMGAN